NTIGRTQRIRHPPNRLTPTQHTPLPLFYLLCFEATGSYLICQRSSLKFIGENRVTVVIKKKEVEAVIAAA
ncbi:unnamed protein product, partial [Didymodactylos carnosus]